MGYIFDKTARIERSEKRVLRSLDLVVLIKLMKF